MGSLAKQTRQPRGAKGGEEDLHPPQHPTMTVFKHPSTPKGLLLNKCRSFKMSLNTQGPGSLFLGCISGPWHSFTIHLTVVSAQTCH